MAILGTEILANLFTILQSRHSEGDLRHLKSLTNMENGNIVSKPQLFLADRGAEIKQIKYVN